MSDDTTTTGQAAGAGMVIIPPDVKAAFPDIVDLVMHSESMNNEERQYWFDILPVMTPEQVQQLRDILMNEKNQLAAIDAKYADGLKQSGVESIQQTDEERRKKHEQLASQESVARDQETVLAEDILKQMD
jgi:hypothetical protein